MAEQPFKVRKLNINGSYILAGDFDPSQNGLYAPVPSLYFKLGSTLIYTKTGNLDTDWIPLENTTITDLINSIFTATGEPTGFPIGENGEVDRTSSTISFNEGSRTFTIAPTTTSYYFFVKGKKYTKTTSSTVTIDAGANTYYIYFDNNGSLQFIGTSSFPKEILLNHAFVAMIVWNGSSAIHIGDERHGCSMDAHTHIRLHTNQGAVYQSGFGLSNFVIDGNGSSDTHATFSIDAGSFRDEDILHVLDSVNTSTAIPEFYRTGSGTWNRAINTGFKFLVSSANSLIEYNQFSGGTWSRVEVPENKFVLRHVVATNDINYPFFSLMGLAEYGNISLARESALTELSTYAGLPFVEFVPIATYIVQSNSTYTNSVNAVIVSTDTGASYIDWRRRGIYLNPNVSEVNVHNSLSGLEGGGGGDFYHSNQPINTSDSVTFAGVTDNGNLNVKFTLNASTGDLDDVSTLNTSSIRFNPSVATSISGFANPSDGKLLHIHNAGSSDIVIKNNSSSSTETNRIITGIGKDLVLKINSFITLQYDNTSSRWRVSAGSTSQFHNDLNSIQGGDGTNYYHSDQAINITSDVSFNSLVLDKTLNLTDETTYTTSGNLTSAQISSNTSVIRLNPSTTTTLHGIGNPTDGKIIMISNVSTTLDITISNESSTETTVGNRLLTGGSRNALGTIVNFVLKRQSSILARYSSSEFRWRFISINDHNNLGNTQGGDSVNNNYYHSNQPINNTDSVSFERGTLGSLGFSAYNPISATGNITSSTFNAQGSSNWQYSSASDSSIHGINQSSILVTFLVIHNLSSANNLTIVNNSSTEPLANRKIITGTGSNIVLRPKNSITLLYDNSSSPNNWKVLGINRHNYFTDIQGGDGTNYYHSNQGINVGDSPSFAGLTIANITYPSADGTVGQFITTDGDGQLSFGSPVLDSYIKRYSSSLDLDATTNLSTVTGSNGSGMYRFWLDSDPRVRGVLYVKSSDLVNSELEISSNKVSGIGGTSNCLNVYYSSSNIVFENKISNDTLVILKIN